MKFKRGIIKRNLDLPWMDARVEENTIVYDYHFYTYGCISPKGVAVSVAPLIDPKDGEFFEVPYDAVEWTGEVEVEL